MQKRVANTEVAIHSYGYHKKRREGDAECYKEHIYLAQRVIQNHKPKIYHSGSVGHYNGRGQKVIDGERQDEHGRGQLVLLLCVDEDDDAIAIDSDDAEYSQHADDDDIGSLQGASRPAVILCAMDYLVVGSTQRVVHFQIEIVPTKTKYRMLRKCLASLCYPRVSSNEVIS